MKKITFISGTYNELDNVKELINRVWIAASEYAQKYEFEYIIIDNDSTDGTQSLLRMLASEDKRLKLIFNMRNFGQIRSGQHVFLQATGDAVIGLASDLQDPPEMIPQLIKKWEEGFKIVLGVKVASEESPFFFFVRRIYYSVVSKLSHVKLLENVTGFGLYDQDVVKEFRKLDDPYPYMRGIICDFGYPVAQIPFVQPLRKRGFTKNNFFTLYDYAMLGLTSFSKIPLRLATMIGFMMSFLSLGVAIVYFLYKLLYWKSFPLGMAPIVIGIFLFSSIQLVFIGVLGEYIGAIHTQVLKRPMVIEKERVNF